MYHALAKHGGMSLQMSCKGDLWIDDHHTADKSPLHRIPTGTDLLICLHKIVLLRLGQLSSKPLGKFAVSVDTAQVLRPWTKSVVFSIK